MSLFASTEIVLNAAEPPPMQALQARFTAIEKDKSEDALHGLAMDLSRRAATLDEPAKVSLWLTGYQALRKALDPAFNPQDTPNLKITPPGGYMPGIAPESIKEPELRHQYQLALAAHHEKLDRHRFQSTLRQQLAEMRFRLPVLLQTRGANSAEQLRNAVNHLKKYPMPDEVLADLLK